MARLGAMAGVSRRLLSQYFRADCCVIATKTGLHVLSQWGIEARPVLTGVRGHVPPLPGRREYTLTCDHESHGAGIRGHLVIMGRIEGREFLLDLSASQFHRPQYGLNVPESVVVRDSGLGTLDLGDGATLTYSAHAEPHTVCWRRTSNWTLSSPRHREVFRLATAELKHVSELVGQYLVEREQGLYGDEVAQ